MPLAVRQAGRCAFCTFRRSYQWMWESSLNNDKRHLSTNRLQNGSKIEQPAWRLKHSRPSKYSRTEPQFLYSKSGSRSNSLLLRHSSFPSNAPRRQSRSYVSRSTPQHSNVLQIRDSPLLGDLRNNLLSKVVQEQFSFYKHELFSSEGIERMKRKFGITSRAELRNMTKGFETLLDRGGNGPTERFLFDKLRKAFGAKDLKGLKLEVQNAFDMHILSSRFSADDIKNQKRLTDLRYPLEWFPATRAMQRKIHLHVGPTNSGKTYHALKKLEAAESGVYAGPLRLLAHEIYTRLNAKGRQCALITGEERRIPENQVSYFSSCTVEMVPLNVAVDVAVIDEIQMIGDDYRGWAWTQALLGVMAKEVHLCGETRTVPLIQDLCAAMGDSLEIHQYERLSPLVTMDESLDGNLKRLRKGDAVIVFSRLGIHAMKTEIEKMTKKRCAVVYGSLPPETRAQQAALFNDPNNDYDILVASDAIGMGLNLAIKRIIFESTMKYDGISLRPIEASMIKQIGGRAGRYKTAINSINSSDIDEPSSLKPSHLVRPKDNGGEVTCLEGFDMRFLKQSMDAEIEPLKSAGITPPSSVFQRFAAYFPEETPFSYILLRLYELSAVHRRFHLCDLSDTLLCADVIQNFNLSVIDRLTFVAGPVNLKLENMLPVVKAFARAIADQTGGDILDMPEVKLELLDSPGTGKEYLNKLEILHKALGLYLWLSYRFTGAFKSQAVAFEAKRLVEEKIDKSLAGAAVLRGYQQQMKLSLARARANLRSMEEGSGQGDVDTRASEDTEIGLPLSWDKSKVQEPLLNNHQADGMRQESYV